MEGAGLMHNIVIGVICLAIGGTAWVVSGHSLTFIPGCAMGCLNIGIGIARLTETRREAPPPATKAMEPTGELWPQLDREGR
jgi:hypothetical protein